MTRLRLESPRRRGAALEVAPSLDEVRGLVGRHGQVCLVHTYIADCETPVSAFLKLRDGGPAFLLESVEHGRLGRHSMIGVRPQAVIRGAGGALVQTLADGSARALDAADPFGAVEDAVQAVGMAPPPESLAFAGGAVGFFGYDLVRTVERLPDQPPDDLGVPDLMALVTGPVVVFDHLDRSLTIAVPCDLDPEGELEAAYWGAVETLTELKELLAGPVPRHEPSEEDPVLGPVTSNVSQERFEASVERTREYIFAGDAFQVVPSQRFSAPIGLDPFSVYRGLRTVNPSPYMYFFETDEVTLVGSSPEMLVKVEDGAVEMHPIAGSRPRGATDDEDDLLRDELLADPKERAEHVMLVQPGPQRRGARVGGGLGAGHRADGRAPLQPRDAHREHRRGPPRRGPAGLGRAAGDLPGGDPLGGAQGARDGDHRRAGDHQARPLRRRRGLPRLGRRPRHLHHHPHHRVPRRRGPRAGGRRHRGRLGPRDRVRGDPEQGGRALSRDRGGRRAGRLVGRRPVAARVVLIDNYDSFTYNLVQYLGELGAEVLVHRHDAIDVAGIAQLGPTHLVVSPGPKTPDEAGISVDAIRELAGTVPILGVCLGHQAIGQAFGGRVVRGREPVHGKTSEIHHDGRTVFSGLDNPTVATRYHSLVVDPDLAPDLERTAWCDGDVVMGVRHRHLPVEGVQFHPESILSGSGKALLSNFLTLTV